jgi:SAM-dependent methyltransferase/uncharacterized protein YbaR (Trm112 family)
VKLSHFEAFAPRCPVCLRAGRQPRGLVLAHVGERTATDVIVATLHCPECQHEYPVLDGIPVIVPELAALLGERGIELMLRDDIDPQLEGLLGDAIGPDSWFDVMRQVQSTYGWDGYADLDPGEPDLADGPVPGAARRCLERLLALAGPAMATPQRILDVGCAAGRTSFALAQALPQALVLGADIHLGLLRLARNAGLGRVSYPRRRIGLVYDRRRFDVAIDGADRTDFWACDATCLPFPSGQSDLCVALNLLDCVGNPRKLLESLAQATCENGRILLATPYDWSTRATPVTAWLGGHSQRASHGGAGEAFLHALLAGPPDHAIPGLGVLAEQSTFTWHTRLHDRSAVQYQTHLVALRRRTVSA